MIDTMFARALLKENRDEELEPFLAELMKKTREGHLSLESKTIHEKIAPYTEGPNSPIAVYKDHYYLRRSFDLETTLLHELKRLMYTPPKLTFTPAPNPQLNALQKKALLNAFSHTTLLISGGPGTGKTYLAKAIIDALLEKNPHAAILFTAPTGKAAFRMKHPNITQGTLHHLLGLREHPTDSFEAKPLVYDLIIADECSMIDAKLFSLLLSSIPSGTHLILMGDPDQLPPVEAGFVFPAFFHIPNFPSIHLTECMRSDRSGILKLSSAIKEGRIIDVFTYLQDPDLPDITLAPFPKEPPIPHTNALTLLTPFRSGYMGSSYCNTYIEAHKKPHLKTPLIITKNDYKHNLMNGDMGWKEGPFGLFPEKIPLALLTEYELAFAISVHKSQGSEFDHVLILLPPGSEAFGKELLYTAVTRAKQSVTIASAPETLTALLTKKAAPTCNLPLRW